MIPVLTKEQAYKLDKDTIDSGHLSQEELMDNAGKAVAQFFCEKIDNPFNQTVVVLCGKGNNGGDGVIAHSYLRYYGVSSKIIFIDKKHGHSKLLKKYKISNNEYSNYNEDDDFFDITLDIDYLIDAMFGIGLKESKFLKNYSKLFFDISNIPTIAIDMPSGMLADGNFLYHNYSNVIFTLALGYPKLGYFDNCNREAISKIINVDIGFSPTFSKKISGSFIVSNNINLVEKSDIDTLVKKYSVFHRKKSKRDKYSTAVSIIAGSDKYPGAAILASKAAFNTGSGYVKLFCPCSNDTKMIIESNIYESVIINDINKYKGDSNPYLIGPGLDYDLGPKLDKYNANNSFVESIINKRNDFLDDRASSYDFEIEHESVYDASFLNYGTRVEDLEERAILTPHFRESQRLFISVSESIDKNYLLTIQKKIKDEQIVILKGPSTFIIKKKEIFIIDNAPAILATAGTGDVLSGILISLLSQGYRRLDASILSVYLHGEAANYYMNNISKDGMTASDLIDCIPHAFNILRNNEE